MPAELTHAEIVAALTSRWPEHRVAPSLGRIRALTELLGDPQRAYPVIHLTGTNGKGSTAAMIESLLRADGLRTGRFTSPHVMTVTERITIDGESITDERFDEVWREIEPYVALVDQRADRRRPDDLLRDHHRDGVRRVRRCTGGCRGGRGRLGRDLGCDERGRCRCRCGDPDRSRSHPPARPYRSPRSRPRRPASSSRARTPSSPGRASRLPQVLLPRCAEVGALPQREGIDFGVIDRKLAVAGQVLRLTGADGPIDEIFLPLYGAHQAANAAQALAAAEAFLGLKALHPDVVREGFAQVHFPGRLELIRRSPALVLDAAHNPHGARAAAAGVTEAFAFSPLIGVIAVMADKDARGILEVFEEIMNQVVISQVASTSRGMPAAELGALAEEIFGSSRVTVVPRLDDAIDRAVELADADGIGSPGVLITGSVVAVGEARTLLVGNEPVLVPSASEDLDGVWDVDYSEDGHEINRDWQ